jgi:superfamily II DNA or RNA helicase
MSHVSLSSAVPLRPYQETGAQGVLDSLAQYRSVLMVMATGLGKTRTGKAIVRGYVEKGLRCLWLVDTDDLVWQACDALQEDPGKVEVDIEKAQRKAETWSSVIVASVQTIRNKKRMRRFSETAFDLIIADEAHKSMTDGWDRIFEYFSGAKILGLTATPDRADRKSLRTRYEDVPFELEIREAIDDGWLVPINQKFITVEGLDYSEIRREAMKLRLGDMESALLNAEMIEKMAIPTRDLLQQRQALVFTCSVDHAYAYAEFLRKLGLEAETVEGDQQRCPPKHRREVIAAYKRGEIQILTNCAALTTGFDAPATSGIVYARPMLSRPLYAQCAGRGTRPINPHELNDLMHGPAELRREAIARSAKHDCLLLDFLGNSGRLKLVRAAKAMDPDIDDETAELAEKIASEQQLTMNEALSIAEEMRNELLKEVGNLNTSAKHSYTVTDVDPFEGSRCQRIFKLLGIQRKTDRWGFGTATPAQVEALRRWKVPDPQVLSRREASDLISEFGKRKNLGLASFRQIELLVNLGKLPPEKVRSLPDSRARKGLDQLKANNWKRPESWGPVKHDRMGA